MHCLAVGIFAVGTIASSQIILSRDLRAELLEISQPGVSKHLRVLRQVGLVQVRQDAQRRWYELLPQPLVDLDAWLASYRPLWEARFDRLDHYLQELQAKENKE